MTDDRDDGGDERCHWIDRPADEILDVSPIKRTLPEVLDAIETNDTIVDINKRIAATTITATQDLLWKLGLRDESGLLDDDVLEARIDEMREVFCDE